MKTLKEIEKNYEKFREFGTMLDGERGEKVQKFFQSREELILSYPASHKSFYHNSFPGGYVDNVLRVTETAVSIHKFWKKRNPELITYSEDSLLFVSLVHSIGKLGSTESPLFLEETEEWKKKKGEFYKFNPEEMYLSIPDRTLVMLGQEGISYSTEEMLAIKLQEGLYNRNNEQYFNIMLPENKLRTFLPYVLCSAIEQSRWIEFRTWFINNK